MVKYVLNNADKFLALCANFDCTASKNNTGSVVKIDMLIRCICCGESMSLSDYQKQKFENDRSKRKYDL